MNCLAVSYFNGIFNAFTDGWVRMNAVEHLI